MRRLTWLVVAVSLASCGGTARTRRTFPVVVSAAPGALVTDSGWAVTLSSASVALSAGRFFSGAAVVSWRPPARPWDWLWGTAWAHPGHYVPGEALGEVLAPVTVDLLAGDTPWGTADAVTGPYGSFELTLGAGGVRLAGTATKGGQTVAFDTGAFTPPAPIEGIPFARDLDTAAGQVRVAVDLAVVLSRVDFSQVGTGAAPLDQASPAFNGFGRGVLDATAYRLSWEARP